MEGMVDQVTVVGVDGAGFIIADFVLGIADQHMVDVGEVVVEIKARPGECTLPLGGQEGRGVVVIAGGKGAGSLPCQGGTGGGGGKELGKIGLGREQGEEQENPF